MDSFLLSEPFLGSCDEGYRFYLNWRFLRPPEKGLGASNFCLTEKQAGGEVLGIFEEVFCDRQHLHAGCSV